MEITRNVVSCTLNVHEDLHMWLICHMTLLVFLPHKINFLHIISCHYISCHYTHKHRFSWAGVRTFKSDWLKAFSPMLVTYFHCA